MMDEEFGIHLQTVLHGVLETRDERLISQALLAWLHDAFDFHLWLAWVSENVEFIWGEEDLV